MCTDFDKHSGVSSLCLDKKHTGSTFDTLTHIWQNGPVMPCRLRARSAFISLCNVAPFNLHQLCIHTHRSVCFLHLRGVFGQWASSAGQLALSVSAAFSNQHIPNSLDRHWETILAAHAQGGVTFISCPLTSDYKHTESLYCLLMFTLKTPHSCSQNTQLFLCFEAAVRVSLSTQGPSVFLCPLPATEPVRSCQSEPVMPHTNTGSPLSVLMTFPQPSFHPSLPSLPAPLGLGLTEPCLQQQ